MEAILFVGHGSRDPEGNTELLHFTEQVTEHLEAPIMETCFLELTQPDIPQGIDRCVARGATSICVIPIMLFSAGHAKVHIPLAIQEGRERYPEVEFRYGRPFGVDENVLPLLKRRMDLIHPLKVNEEGERHPIAVLLVGRGSSDPDANSDLYKISRLFWEQTRVKWVETSFIGVTDPRFEEGLERCLRLGAQQCIVLPYFLFTGVLIKRMEEKLVRFASAHPDLTVQMGSYLGLDEGLIPILLDRVREVEREGGSDWQALAESAEAAGHHHHHHHHHPHDHAHRHRPVHPAG
ncbi:sirohydrochlorin chelatase [Salinithrix halophila]|uniref:Sirohydrochlorin chelatase n=1 Tax=Salinithrix halophila TaxID=1485204 RepID=A0ABV8JJ33_9BACL